MKIAYIATSSIPSTTANSIQVMKVCQALTLNGHEVVLLVPGRGELNWMELKAQYGLTDIFPIVRIPSRKLLKRFDFIFTALKAAQKQSADVIYTRMLWVAVIAQFRRMSVILELHDVPAGRFGKLLFARYLASESKKLTVLITQALGSVIEDQFGIQIPRSECIVAPDGVDLERYANLPNPSQARQKLGLNESVTAVYTGGFYKGRGLELLLELAKAFPKVQFLWVGGKPEDVTAWNAFINNLGISNTKLTGFIPNEELPLYQAAADILLMPFARSVSGSSGGNTADVCSPMKMFEYMAAGRAILTSDLPVLREVLNEQNAVFYAPEDLEELKAKFAQLVNDSDWREALSGQAKLDARHFSWQERMQKIISSI